MGFLSDLFDAAKKQGVTLMEAMISTLNPNFAIVKEHLKDLGTIRRYFASYCQYSSRYDKFKEGIVLNAFKPELSNGAMMDIGIYTVGKFIFRKKSETYIGRLCRGWAGHCKNKL